jgi:hypothetical protein
MISARLLLVGTLVAGAACTKAGNAPAIEGVRPASESRAALLATITIAPPDTIVGHVDALSRTLGLPFTGKDLLTTLTAQYALAPDALSLLDGGRPIAIAYVAPPARDQPVLDALAVIGRSPEATERLVGALGPATPVEKGIRRVQRAGAASLLVATQGTTLLASSTREGLAAAGALAFEALRPPASDLTVTVRPEAMARWHGTDVRTALADFRKELFQQQIAAAERRGGLVPGRAERIAWEAISQALLDPLADTVTDSFTLDIDPQRGIRLGVRLQPRAGTAFARRVAAPTPHAVDPAVIADRADAPLVAVASVGPSPFWPELYASVLAAQAQAGIRGAPEVASRFEALRPWLTGAGSAELRAGNAGLTTGAVLSLRPGPAPGGALDALGSLTGSPGFATLLGEIYGRQAPTVQSKRDGDILRTELAFPIHRPGDVGTALKAVFGSSTLSTLATVSRGGLVVALGPEARPQLARLAAASATPPPAELAVALAESRGSDGLFYLDVWAAARPVLSALRDPQVTPMLGMVSGMPGFARLKLPVVMSYRGGDALTGELRIPLATLRSAAAAVGPLVGAGPAAGP